MNKTLLVAALTLFLGACGGSDKKAQSAQGGNQAAASESANIPLIATNELNLYIWSDYSDPSTVTQFGKDNKLTINESFYDSNEMLEAKVLTGKSGYDLVAPSLSNVAVKSMQAHIAR